MRHEAERRSTREYRGPAAAGLSPVRRSHRRWTVAFLLLLLAPPEMQFTAGSLVLSPQRVGAFLCLLAAPFLASRSARSTDWLCGGLAVAHALWAAGALLHANGVNGGLQFAGAYGIEFLGPYMLARAVIGTREDFDAFARWLIRIIAVLVPFTLLEAATGSHLLRNAPGLLFGSEPLHIFEERMGFQRAFGPFQHPILYGVFCSVGIGLAWYIRPVSGRRSLLQLWRIPVVIVATLASLSTGPLMACTTQLGLIAWDRCTRGIRGRWWLLAAGLGAAYIAVDALSNRDPITVFISYATFNPETGYGRQLIWDYGFAEVLRHPLLGIGLNDWQRPEWMISPSVDNFWLLTAMRYGLPAVAALFAVVVTVTIRLAKRHEPCLQEAKMGWIVSFAGLSLAAVTVHLWGSAFMLFAFMLGAGVSLSRAAEPLRRAPPAPWPTEGATS